MSEFIKRLKELENIKDDLTRERGIAFYIINHLRENKCCIPTEDWVAIVNHDYDPWCLIDEVTEHWTDHQKRDVMFTWSGEFEKVKLNINDEITEPFMFWPKGTHGIDVLDAMEEFFGINEEEEDDMEKEISYTFEDGEQADIYRHGNNDYSVYFHNGDYSVRGSLWEIMDEVKECEEHSRLAEDDEENHLMVSEGNYLNFWTTGGDYDVFIIYHEMELFTNDDIVERVVHHIMDHRKVNDTKEQLAKKIHDALEALVDWEYNTPHVIVDSMKGSDN